MRCDRFRSEMMKTPLSARTRAERALFVRHSNNCVPCWNWMIEIAERHRGSTASQLAYPKTLLDADNKDPEFLQVIQSKEIIET